jgi:fucose permease
MMAAGLGALVVRWPLILLAVGVMGFGLGLAIPATNIVVAQRHPARRAAALSHLNLLWGIGACSAPLAFAALRPIGLVGWTPVVLAAPMALLAVFVAAAPPLDVQAPVRGTSVLPVSPLVLVLIAVQMFLYTGAESAMVAWTISLTKEYTSAESVTADLVGAGFWMALLLGRAAAPAVLRYVTESALHRGALLLAAASAALLLASRAPWMLGAGAVLCGLAFSPIFPILAATLVGYTDRRRPAAAGPVFAMAGFGGGVQPWLAGQVVAGAATVRPALLVPAAAVVLMALLQGREQAGVREASLEAV